jgi:glycerol-3-phosphate dehydrogenase
VIATWAGLRPLIAVDAGRPSDVSREHEIFVRDEGVVIIAGGKLTTYRRMAKEVVDKTVEHLDDRGEAVFDGRLIKKCRTKHRSLPGAHGMEPRGGAGVKMIAERLEASAKLEPRVAEHLSQAYGVRAESVVLRGLADRTLLERIDPELPYLWAEVDHAVDVDLAKTIEDVLVRRVPLCLRARGQGLKVIDRVADRMAVKLGWSQAERARQIGAYRDYVAATSRFR